MDDATLIQMLKALADPTRFRILREVAAAGELTCGGVGERFTLAQPTVSHHIHILIEAGLLTVRRSGQQGFVSVDRAALERLPALLTGTLLGEPAPPPPARDEEPEPTA